MMTEQILTTLIWLPALAGGLFVLVPMPRWMSRIAGISAGAVTTAVAMRLLFIPPSTGVVFVERRLWIDTFGIAYHVGFDGVTLVMLLGICVFMLLLQVGADDSCGRGRRGLLLIVQGGAIGTLVAQDLVVFLMFWGAVGMSFAFLAGSNGTGRRTSAIGFAGAWTISMLLLFTVITYTAVTYRMQTGDWSLAISDLQLIVFSPHVSWVLMSLAVAAFLIVMPVPPLHGWYVSALVESAGAGAAAIMALSGGLGVAGLVRIVFPLFPAPISAIAPFMVYFGLAGALLIGISALGRTDVKRMVGLVSIVFACISLSATFALQLEAIVGGMIVIAAGGLLTGGMALLRWPCGNEVEEVPSRAPIFATAAAMAAGAPGSLMFVGIMLVAFGCARQSVAAAVIAGVGFVVLAGMLVRLVRRACEEPRQQRNTAGPVAAILLIVVVLVSGVYPGPVVDRMSRAASRTVEVLKARAIVTSQLAREER